MARTLQAAALPRIESRQVPAAATLAVRADPVADLAGLGAVAQVKPRAADDPVRVPLEDAVDVVLVEVEGSPEPAQTVDLLIQRLGLVCSPRHPGQPHMSDRAEATVRPAPAGAS